MHRHTTHLYNQASLHDMLTKHTKQLGTQKSWYCMYRTWHRVTADVQGSDLQLDVHDANEPNTLEPQHLPDTDILAEGFRGCLQVCYCC